MTKLVFILLGSIWLSCGNTPQAAQNKPSVSPVEKENSQIAIASTDTVISHEGEEEVALVSEKDNDVERTSHNQELSAKDETSESTAFTVNYLGASPRGIRKEKTVQFRGKPRSILNLDYRVKKTKSKEKEAVKPDHSKWRGLLAKYVNGNGDVDYRGFQNDASSLNEYLSHLAENSPEKEWSKNEKLAYYINLYNAATVKLILDNYPTKSIKNIKNPWGKDWVKTGDGLLSLGDIEHKILRKMNEPRIHFAINCASYSCPKLVNKAFTASQMETQLHEATLDFINDTTRNIISEKKMQLSNIFKWYKKDFTESGSLTDYIKPYTKVEIDNDTAIDYLKYDWNLNEAK